MKEFTMQEAAKGARGKIVTGCGEAIVGEVVIDSREGNEKALFVAILGENQDGHIFAEKAAELGCTKFMLSDEAVIRRIAERFPESTILQVEDTTVGLQELARNYLAQFHLIKIGVTGSTGKTTTKEMLYAIFSRKFKTIRNEGNRNNHLGLPLTIFKVEDTTEAAIFEMGMSRLGEISLLADIVRPNLAIITNVGTSHIEFLKTRENILRAKMEVTDYFDRPNMLVVNSDNEYLSVDAISKCVTMKQKEDSSYTGMFRLITAGEQGTPDIYLSDRMDLGETGIEFRLTSGGTVQKFHLPLLGNHNGWNAMVAVGAGLQYGISMQEAANGLEAMEATSRRLRAEEYGEIKLIDDTYNASPDSMAAAVDVLMAMQGKRKIAILSDILELGNQSEKIHREVGRYAAQSGMELLIAIGENARYIAEGAQELAGKDMEIMYFETRESLLLQLRELLKSGDVVLVKGSNGMKMTEVVNTIKNF